MFTNYFKIAWRNLKKNKIFSLINISGLTIGITVCLLIFLYIQNEFSFDKFHADGKRIYRVMRTMELDKLPAKVPYVSGPYATALLNDFQGEIVSAVRVMPSNALVTSGTRSFNEKKLILTDEPFFSMFSFPLLKGDPNTVLKEPGSIVLTETAARKYFGEENPIGKRLELDKEIQLTVTGVAKDIPANSHLEFDMVAPLSNYYNRPWFKVWINNSMFTYTLLKDEGSAARLERQFPAFMQKYMGKEMERFQSKVGLTLNPLNEIYFESATRFDAVRHGDKKVVYIFLSIAVLILVIACINFMNLSTMRAVERSKEVGLRKVMGALRNHLVAQFIGESILLALISCLFAVMLTLILLPFYNHILGYTLAIEWTRFPIYGFLGSVVLLVGAFAGTYPAIFLSAYSPIQALKGKLNLGREGSWFRQGLVVVQFSISVLLIIGTIFITKQMSYVRSRELGFDQSQTLVIPIDNNEFYDNRFHFKKELERQSGIASVSLVSGEPGGFFDTHTFEAEGMDGQVLKSCTEFTDFDMVKTLNLKVIAGRDFDRSFPTDSAGSVLINETAARALGCQQPEQAIGKWIKNTIRDTERRHIIGVVADYNFQSLKQQVNPLVISPSDDNRVALVKFKSGRIADNIAAVKQQYSAAAPQFPFEYNFLDEKFDQLYKTDLKQQQIMTIFAALAIFIACLGLFGLASFTAARRTKEIGVRKVLGSSESNIILLLSKDLMKPVVLATCIAIPLGYYAMSQWLQNFAYRTGLDWWVFVLAAATAAIVAMLTVGFQALKAALANPVKSLRSE
ncbi:ABC transporter permease [Flavihumibacter petaseus]|nr:ABC transporter permease [Flavihumibacter petaseus]